MAGIVQKCQTLVTKRSIGHSLLSCSLHQLGYDAIRRLPLHNWRDFVIQQVRHIGWPCTIFSATWQATRVSSFTTVGAVQADWMDTQIQTGVTANVGGPPPGC